ncbi:hypothetical protein B0H13DRAFT_2004505 [Mycena leptocephala]|nr:hypothetical protein B0H13DRAFT_2004505 [Mycena leptocephala]
MSSSSNWRNVDVSRGAGNKWRGTRPHTQLHLKDFEVQDEYREYIQGKLNEIWEKYPRPPTESEKEGRQRVDSQENVLILFRKLREGIISSKRIGQFALEVYETSLYLAVVFDSPRISVQSFPPHRNCVQTVLVCLLHHLVAGYPSQREFRAHLTSVPKAFFPDGSAERVWITSVAGCIRARNYAKINKLTQVYSLPVDDTTLSFALRESNPELPCKALYHLVDSLRNKTREMAWTVMRTAYRELLVSIDLNEWLDRESGLGHIRRKDGVEGRWIVCKPR